MECVREGEVFLPGVSGEADSVRAWRPWVFEEDDGTLRMWYSGDDGTTWRILEAVQHGGGTWERLGVAIDAGFAGDSDEYGVESPCVVKTPAGYLMVYAGFDGDVTRLHMATSLDGHQWVAQGTIMQRGREDADRHVFRSERTNSGHQGSSRNRVVERGLDPIGASLSTPGAGNVLQPPNHSKERTPC